MRRKWYILAGVLCLCLLVISPIYAQGRSIFWERWDVVIDEIDTTNNSYRVQEIYDIQFTGRYTFGAATIPDENLDRIDNVIVYENGQALRASCSESAGTYCVQAVQEGTSIVYYFNRPLTDTTQEFTLEYTVIGALRTYDGGDQLWWTAIPSDHFGYSIGSSTVTVEMPMDSIPREGVDPVVTYGASTTVDVANNIIQAVATGPLGGNDYLEIRVQYPHDPNARTPAWQSDFDSQRAFEEDVKPILDIALIMLGLLIGIGGPLAVFAVWYNKGRDPKVGPVPEHLSELPTDLPPALVGTLVDEKADVRDVLSTLLHLASRGYLVIEENRTEGVVFGLGAKSEFAFKRTDKPINDLRNFEQKLIQKVFSSGMERSMDSLRNKFYNYIPQLQNDLYKELVKEKLFTTSPQTTRTMWSTVAMVILGIAVLLGFLLSGETENISVLLLCLPASLGATRIAAIIASQHMPAKTREGALEAAKWNAFRQFMKNVEKYKDMDDVATNFDDYLAYAIAFGIDRSWIQRFSKVPTTSMPIWYFPTYRGGYYSGGYRAGSPLPRSSGMPSAKDVLPGEMTSADGGGFSLNDMAGDITGGLESISSGLTNMLESASSTFTSKPQSSSSGSWGSGGSSWSGGGSGGGGSSGGGSRGFG